MRWLRLAVSAVALAAWLAGSAAQQGQPPAGSAPPPVSSPRAGTPAPSTPPATSPPAAQAEKEDEAKPPAEVENEVFVPTEELQPDAAITFPVDI